MQAGTCDGTVNREWTNILARALEKVNPFCCFAFKYHWMKSQPSRKASAYCFRAQAICTFKDCSMQCVLKVRAYDLSNHPPHLDVDLIFSTTTICHGKGERRARHIKGNCKQALIDELKYKKPSTVRQQRLLQLSNEAFVSGKRDGVGVSPSVLHKISSESLHSEDLDPNVCIALMMLREKQISEDTNGMVLPGYIQRVHAHPFSVTCFTETADVKLYHTLGDTTVLYCDATGTLTTMRSNSMLTGSSKVLLYYSLVLKHPKANNPPVAVAELISSEHSVLAICHFLESFRRAEGLLYGSTNLVKPRIVVVDRSMVLLTSFLRVYNLETMSSYLHQCFRVVTGYGSDDDCQKLFVLACIAHVMKNAKDEFKRVL